MFYKIITKQALYRHLITRRVLLTLVILKHLNELFSKKEQENKLTPEGLNQGAEVFTYDPVGNRLTEPKEKLNYTYNQGNQLTELAKVSLIPLNKGGQGVVGGEGVVQNEQEKKVEFTYDKNGNLIKKVEYNDEGNIKRITLYTYDFENRLIRVEIQKDGREKIIEFTYDPFSRRLSKVIHRHEIDDDDDGEKDDDEHEHPRATYYVYDNEDIIMEYNHKGKVKARYIHGLGIDEPLAIERLAPERLNQGKGKVYYYHFDGLGSVTSLTDNKGKVAQRYEYNSFGKLKRHGHKVKQPYTYTGREWDKEIGLYYHRARYYDPQIGRFISVDPIVRGINHTKGVSCSQSISRFPLDKPKKLHPFVYTENNPINYVDPKGLQCGPGTLGDWLWPDSWGGIDFSIPCSIHDKCYSKCGKTKYECDDEFLKGMKLVCSYTGPFYPNCITIAYLQYGLVLTQWGQDSYDRAQKDACCKK